MEVGRFLKNYENGQNVLGVHVFWVKKSCNPKRFHGQAGQRAKSCGGCTFWLSNRLQYGVIDYCML